MNNAFHLFLTLVRASVTGSLDELKACLPIEPSMWKDIFILARVNRMTRLTFDVISAYIKATGSKAGMDEHLLLQWYSQSMMQTRAYRRWKEESTEFATALTDARIRCVALKGLATACYYKYPEWREAGDLDIYLGKDFEKGNDMARKLGARTDEGPYKHSHIYYKHLLIENHRYFTDFNETRNGTNIEKRLRAILAAEGVTPIEGTSLFRPSAHFDALFLTKHSMLHFFTEGLPLRYVYDWAMFLTAEQDHLHWKALYEEMDSLRLRRFADVMTAICVEHLGVELHNPDITVCRDRKMVQKFLNDLMQSGKVLPSGESFLQKTRRIAGRLTGRLWTFRKLNSEVYRTALWNSFAFSSYFHRKVHLE